MEIHCGKVTPTSVSQEIRKIMRKKSLTEFQYILQVSRAVQRRPHVSYGIKLGPFLLLEAHGGTEGKGIARKQCSGGRTVGFTQIV